MQGHISLIGGFPDGALGVLLRFALGFGGLFLAAPGGGELGVSHGVLILAGAALAAAPVAFALLRHREA